MPASYLMKWEPMQGLWRKMYKTQRYVISCRQLSAWSGEFVPETKEGSYQTANAWWLAKKAEIDGQQPPHPHASYFAELSRRRDWVRRRDSPEIAAFISREIAKVEGGERPQVDRFGCWDGSDEDFMAALVVAQKTSRDIIEVLRTISPGNPVWEDRIKRDEPVPVPDDRTMKVQVDRYIELERMRADDGHVGPGEFDTIRRCLYYLRDWIGGELPVDVINPDKVEAYWVHLFKWDRSVDYKKKRLRIARAFIRWLASKGLIPLPPNLSDRKHRFGGSAKAIVTMTIDEVRVLVKNATGELQLHLLLMLNCGMTQIDISNLRQVEVDWERGRIIRKRSKERIYKNAPIVSYRLWPQTLELLQRYRQPSGDRVLLNERGKPWVQDRLDKNGKRRKSDAIDTRFDKLRVRLGITKSLNKFRKTSATLIESHKVFRGLKDLFLGHSPRTIAEIHYADAPVKLLDEAVEWLGQEYGFIPCAKSCVSDSESGGD